MHHNHHQRQRWYDQEIACHKLLEQIRAMPQPESREFAAMVLIHFSEKLRKELQLRGKNTLGVSSIGVPAISSLYNFGYKKRRWYDVETVLHKAVGLFYTLPVEGLSVIGFKLDDTFGLLQIYSTVCHQVDQPPDPKEMVHICTTALKVGRSEAESVLISIVGQDLYDSVNPRYAEGDPLGSQPE